MIGVVTYNDARFAHDLEWTVLSNINNANYGISAKSIFKNLNSKFGIGLQVTKGEYCLGILPNALESQKKSSIYSLAYEIRHYIEHNVKCVDDAFVSVIKMNEKQTHIMVCVRKYKILVDTTITRDSDNSVEYRKISEIIRLLAIGYQQIMLISNDEVASNKLIAKLNISDIITVETTLLNENPIEKLEAQAKLRDCSRLSGILKKKEEKSSSVWVGLALVIAGSLSYFYLSSSDVSDDAFNQAINKSSQEPMAKSTTIESYGLPISNTVLEDGKRYLASEANWDKRALTKLVYSNNANHLPNLFRSIGKMSSSVNGWTLSFVTLTINYLELDPSLDQQYFIETDWVKVDRTSTVDDFLKIYPDATVSSDGNFSKVVKLDSYPISIERYNYEDAKKITKNKINSIKSDLQRLKTVSRIKDWSITDNLMFKRPRKIEPKEGVEPTLASGGWLIGANRSFLGIQFKYLTNVNKISQVFKKYPSISFNKITYDTNTQMVVLEGSIYEL